MSNQIAIMREGGIEQLGSATELYEEPVNAFVADFVGESNFLQGTVRELHGDGLVTIEHSSGRLLRAAGHTAVQAGAAVLASVRPERILVTSNPKANTSTNSWRGRVIDVIYVGDSIKYKIAVGDEVLTAKIPKRDSTPELSVGDEAGVNWDPVHTRLLSGKVECRNN